MLSPEWKEVAQMWLAVAAISGASAIGLRIRDFIRIGRTRRRKELLRARGVALTLPDGRVPCPECGEGILPHARRCPFCRQVVEDRM